MSNTAIVKFELGLDHGDYSARSDFKTNLTLVENFRKITLKTIF